MHEPAKEWEFVFSGIEPRDQAILDGWLAKMKAT
jgi:hypothetical protein